MTRHGWIRATVGDAGEYINGLAFKPTDWGPDGRPIIRIQNLTDPTRPFNRTTRVVAPQHVVRSGDILVSWSATLDAFVWRGPEAVLNQHIFRVVPRRDVVSDAFLYYQLKHVIEEMWRSEHTHGSTMRHINRGPFLAHPFWLPPAAAQKVIVDALDAQFTRLDAAVASLTRAKANVASARASVLKAAVEGRLVPTEAELARTEGRPAASAAAMLEAQHPGRALVGPPAYAGGVLPDGWAWCRVDEVASSLRYGTSAKCSKEQPGVAILRMGNIAGGRLDLSDLKYLPPGHPTLDGLILNPGDVLFSRTNSAELVGKTAVYHGSPAPCACASYLIRLVPGPCLIGDYLSSNLNSFVGRTWVRSVVSQQVGQANVNGTKLRAYTLALPPLSEQRRIVDEIERRISVLDAIEAGADAALARCSRLRQAILAQAFGGRLATGEQSGAASPMPPPSAVEVVR